MPKQRAPLTKPRFRLTCCAPSVFNRLLGIFFCGYRLSNRAVMVFLVTVGAFSMATTMGVYFFVVHRELFTTTGELLLMTPLTLYLALGAGYLWVRAIFSDPGYAESPDGERVRGFAADFLLNTPLGAAGAASVEAGEAPRATSAESSVAASSTTADADAGASAGYDVVARPASTRDEMKLGIVSMSEDYERYTAGTLTARELYTRHARIIDRPFEEFEQVLTRRCNVCKINRSLEYHHCRACQRCVQAQDHHCPFIANCVGKRNRGLFLVTLFYIALGGLYSLLACVAYLHRLGYSDYGLRASMQLGLSTDAVFGSLRALRDAGMFATWARPLVMTSLLLSAVWTFFFGMLFFWNAWLAAVGVTQLHLLTLMSTYSWRQIVRRAWRDMALANLHTHLAPHGLRPGALLWYRW